MPTSEQTVPNALIGCWRRNWIRFGDDGERDASVAVVWLQTASGMGDVRIDPAQQPVDTDSSCGITMVDEAASPYPTADWSDGAHGFSQQPVSRFPEKGWLDWHSDTLLYELAPSGAYVEEWERLPGSAGLAEHKIALDSPTRTNLYTAGSHVFLAVERSAGDPIHEFSYGQRSPNGDVVIELSTLAERVGQAMHLAYEWKLISQTNSL